jgi:hypothetical protein
VVNVINALITIPTDGIVLIVISFGTIQTGIKFHYDFLSSGGHCIPKGLRQLSCFHGQSPHLWTSDELSISALLPDVAATIFGLQAR